MIIKLLLLNIIFFTNIYALQNINLTKEEQNYLNNKKVINVCIDPNWLPFEGFDKSDKHIGLSSEYFKIFQQQLNIPINSVMNKQQF